MFCIIPAFRFAQHYEYKTAILYNFDELNDPTGRRAPVPAFTTFHHKIVDKRDYLC